MNLSEVTGLLGLMVMKPMRKRSSIARNARPVAVFMSAMRVR